MYHCAQTSSRQHAPKKTEREGAKSRDKLAMESFPCQGWPHITVNDWDEVAWVKISRKDDHVPYYSIDVPPHIVDFVHQNHKLTPTQVSFRTMTALNNLIQSY